MIAALFPNGGESWCQAQSCVADHIGVITIARRSQSPLLRTRISGL